MCLSVGHLASSAQATSFPANKQNEDQIHLVHFGDIIDVDVVGSFEFDWRGTLTPDGFLDGLDAYSESIYGLCRSESQIAADVRRAYSRILRDPHVVVRIVDRSNRATARVDGAVRNPTRFRIQRKVSLQELLIRSGGLTDAASGEISIFRAVDLSCRTNANPALVGGQLTGANDDVSMIMNVKISELLKGKPDANPLILSGDVVTVKSAEPVYVTGAVANARLVYIRDQATVTKAIAAAGGLSGDADGTIVTIFRRGGRDTKTIDLDMGKIVRGETIDPALKPFDIIDVGSRGGGKRKYPPASAPERPKQQLSELPLRIID
ncbi:MAG: SLBB domain-containing protein [Pyrinomonadaceae bacterium]